MVPLDHVELVDFSKDIPVLLRQARAPTTNASYGLAYKRWVAWADQYPEISLLPAEPLHVGVYLSYLSRTAKSFASINLAVCAINWYHSLAGVPSPTKDILVNEILSGIKRQLAKPRAPKDPLLPEHIEKIFDSVNVESLTDLRNTTLIVLGYYALLRFDEIRQIKISHITFHASHLEISVPKSKADQLRQGDTVVVARLGGPRCPVALTERYLSESALLSDSESEDNFMFRRCLSVQGKAYLTKKVLAITYNSVREIIKSKVVQLGLNPKDFSTHSMRSGGASAAANSNVGDRILQRHGRWATAGSRDRYVKDSLEKRLTVSQRLGGVTDVVCV
jgi:integrase